MAMVQVWPNKQWLTADTWRPTYVAWLVDDYGDFVTTVGEHPDHITAFKIGRKEAEKRGIECYMHDELPENDK